MQTRTLGASGLRVSRLGLGTMTWGRDTNADEAKEQWALFRAAGGTLVDTAASYGDGAAETMLGELLAGRTDRDETIVSTKAGLTRRTGARVVDASRRALLDALDGSLRRLRLDHVDLWEVHAWDGSVPIDETMSALDVAVTSGRVRYVGASNFDGWQTATAATWQRAWPGRAPLVAAQVEYSLLRRGIEADLLPACAHHGLGVLAWSPLAGGVLTGKYRGGVPRGSRGSAAYWRDRIDGYRDARSVRIVDALATAADGLGTSPLAVALTWTRDREGVAAALVGARSSAQLTASLATETFSLPAEITAALDDASR